MLFSVSRNIFLGIGDLYVTVFGGRNRRLGNLLGQGYTYDEAMAHIANQRIDIDLDDGVKVNYEKVQTGRDGKKMQILTKI